MYIGDLISSHLLCCIWFYGIWCTTVYLHLTNCMHFLSNEHGWWVMLKFLFLDLASLCCSLLCACIDAGMHCMTMTWWWAWSVRNRIMKYTFCVLASKQIPHCPIQALHAGVQSCKATTMTRHLVMRLSLWRFTCRPGFSLIFMACYQLWVHVLPGMFNKRMPRWLCRSTFLLICIAAYFYSIVIPFLFFQVQDVTSLAVRDL